MPELARFNWPDAQKAIAQADLAVVAVGSCEQHGPHLTLDTDSAIAQAFARRLAGDLGGRAVDRLRWFHEWTENGALGDPRLASVELGEDIVETAYARALGFAHRFAEEPLPGDGG